MELAGWLAFSAGLIHVLYLRPVLGAATTPWTYVAFGVLLAYARNVRYFGRPGAGRCEQAGIFLLSPLYALLHAVLLTPLRFWALLTLRSRGWGTRQRVEVRAREAAGTAPGGEGPARSSRERSHAPNAMASSGRER